MIRSSLLCLWLMLAATTALAAPQEMILYQDGALVSYEVVARKGLVELALPAGIREGTLRISPLDGGSITRVALLPERLPLKRQQEIAALTEQKSRLQDRLKALETREAIFTSAAKSQSSKAPRKSKTNPDPLASVRQGTDFAIAQLEAVYTSRRRTEQELRRLDAHFAALSQQPGSGPTVSVAVTPVNARVKISVTLTSGGWLPRYDIRLSGDGTALLSMSADLSGVDSVSRQNSSISVVPAQLQADALQPSFTLQQGHAPLQGATWQVPVSSEQFTTGPLNRFSFTLQNTSRITLPTGQAAVYRHNEYIGTLTVPTLVPGGTVTLSSPHK